MSAPASDDAGETRIVPTVSAVPLPRDDEPTGPLLTGVTVPIPRAVGPEIMLRFGPGVPTQRPARPAEETPAEDTAAKPRRRSWRALNLLLTAALALLVLWLVWPSAPLRVRQVSVPAPATVSCSSSTDVVATLRTNGNPGTIRYQWFRNDDVRSPLLTAKSARGQDAVNVRMHWAFTGPGSYAATATVVVREPGAESASASFIYRC